MMRRYGWLFLFALGAAVVAAVMGKGVRPVATEQKLAVAAPVSMAVEILEHDVLASTTTIPAGVAVHLTITNTSARPVRVRLAGYEDRVDTGMLAPGDTASTVFLADRPGERFTWLVGDEPRGRIDVTGSHLVEGHR